MMEMPPWRQSKGIPESAAPEDLFSHVPGGLSYLQDLSDAAALVFQLHSPVCAPCLSPVLYFGSGMPLD